MGGGQGGSLLGREKRPTAARARPPRENGRRASKLLRRYGLAAMLTAAVATSDARAQDVRTPDPLQAAFVAMMARPGDPDLAIRYARLAAARGESRAAIAALERVLRINPSLDNVRLELASLHLAAGSTDLAAAYAAQAMSSPAMPAEVAPRAQTLQAQAERGSRRSLFEASLYLGGRYDTNANEATALGTVPVFVPVLQDFFNVATPFRGKPDWSLVLGARAAHRYDLGLQREGTWETNFAGFEQRFAKIQRAFDLSIVSFDTGPRIGIAEWGGGAALLALRPFATVAWLGYGGRTYSSLYGGGLTAELRFPPRWTTELTYTGRFGNYENTDFRPRAREFTGFENAVSLVAGYRVTDSTRVSVGATYFGSDARQSYFRREGYGGGAAVNSLVPVTAAYSIGAVARANYRRVAFDSPDPLLDPTRSRRDSRYEAGASLIFPVLTNLAVVADYDWYEQRSNYDFYRYGNHAFSVGVRLSL